ncbi:MAG: endonuclease/exonuclease/phosphatase family protein [Lamprobacter sp.]|uniref:endonuclease/exonuclease/phosphatase family protein n=1 Tax=Lamprobacter sp. TaxID=3100796 RepID=UPI002B25DBA4|nr:endonuclease/exonuclease/phosphatase family protein [Lamprobacter sp.]MEA3638513.1 endonuclease/exonuclease/phosphatase family protein [Lamprobacter sp.]
MGLRETIRVASYNIHRAVGGDRRKDPLRIAETIAALDADLIALQEVETPVREAPLIFLQRLAALGYEARLGHTMQRGAHHYGNLLLSRLPVLSHHRLDISQPGREPRGLIDVRITLGSLSPPAGAEASATAAPLVLRCLATHLGLNASERRRQIAAILSHLRTTSPGGCALTVLMGDFNEWRRNSPRLAPIDRLLRPAAMPASFPSGWPLLALDRLWHGHGLELVEGSVVRTSATRAASDHLPLWAELRLRSAGEAGAPDCACSRLVADLGG